MRTRALFAVALRPRHDGLIRIPPLRVGAGVTAPLFHGGALLNQRRAAQDMALGGAKADELVARILKKPANERFKLLRETDHPQAQFLWAVFRDVFHYIAVHLESIADNARDVDFAIRWGFGWNEGPFETWQSAGWKEIAGWVSEDIAAGKGLSTAPLPAWVSEIEGVHTAAGSYAPAKKAFVPRSTLPVYQRQAFPAALVGENGADP